MFKKLLLAVGLAKAPAPIRTYVAASSFFGTIPAIAGVAWKNREAIKSGIQRLRGRQAAPAPAPALAA